MYIVTQKNIFWYNYFNKRLYLSKNSEKSITGAKKILSSTTVFNIANKSAYYYDFWRSCDTEDWSNDAENTALYHRNKLQFKV